MAQRIRHGWVGVVVGAIALAVAACGNVATAHRSQSSSTAATRDASWLAKVQAKAPHWEQVQYGKMFAWNPNDLPETVHGFKVMQGLNPDLPGAVAWVQGADESPHMDGTQQVFFDVAVWTVIAGPYKNDVLSSGCGEGYWASPHDFVIEPTYGPSLPTGSLAYEPVMKNGQPVRLPNGNVEHHLVKLTSPMRQPGPFLPGYELGHWTGRRWVYAQPYGWFEGHFSCE